MGECHPVNQVELSISSSVPGKIIIKGLILILFKDCKIIHLFNKKNKNKLYNYRHKSSSVDPNSSKRKKSTDSNSVSEQLSSKNSQNTGRELLTPDEVRMLDNKYALLFIRGEKPVRDLKFNMLKHKNIEYTANGKEKPYEHGKTDEKIAEVSFKETEEIDEGANQVEKIETKYELLSEDEVQQLLAEESNN